MYQTWTSIRKILLLTPLLFPFLVQAQDRCGTVEYQKKLQSQQLIQESTPAFEQWLSKKIRQRSQGTEPFRTKSAYTIPVVVHIIHNGEPVGTGTNISDAQVLSQIAVLNKDYQRLNSDAANTPAEFLPVAGSMDIEFALARRSPEGLPTNGIVRIDGGEPAWTSHDNSQLKALSYWDAEDYLNIWVCNITDFIGYAQFPVSDLPGLENSPENRLTDGVVISYEVFGSTDYGAFDLDPNYNKGRTTTHEVGHFFGLRHIWGDDGGSCSGNGDYVNDTPNQAGSTSNCPSGTRLSCTVSTMYQNYLDYTDDECMNLFTAGQVSRMATVLESSPRRLSLLTSDGLDDPDPVTVENLTLKSILAPVVTCATQSVIRLKIKNSGIPVTSFKVRATINDDVSIIEFNDIDFPTGDEENFELPVVSLTNNQGLMTFEVFDPNGVEDQFPDDNTMDHQTLVNLARDFIPLKENFDKVFSERWLINNPSLGMLFQDVMTNFNNSLYFNAFSNLNIGDNCWLVSPLLDLSGHTEASVFFDLSYAYRTGTYDNLKILASTDCGQTFDAVIFDETGTELSENTSTTSWEPSNDEDWTRKYASLSTLIGEPNVRLAFVFTNDNGNNLYLDNIEFFTSDNPDPPVVDQVFSVYPNPGTAATTTLTLNLPEREPIQIEMIDAMGKLMLTQSMTDALNQTIPLPLLNAVPGLYFIRVITAENIYTQKIILLQP